VRGPASLLPIRRAALSVEPGCVVC